MTLTETIRTNWQSIIVGIAGFWIVASPFIFEDTGIGVTLSGVLVGLILAGYGVYDIKQKQIWGQRIARYWSMIGLGLWIAVSPWFFHTPNPLRASNLITGLVIAAVAGHQLYLKSEREIDPTRLGSNYKK